MFEITNLEQVNDKWQGYEKITSFLLKLGGVVELIVILIVWIAIFRHETTFGGYTRPEIITYIIGGSIIGLFSGYLLQRLIATDLKSEKSMLLVYRPIKYFSHILISGWGKIMLPFLVAIGLYFVILLYFSNSFVINTNPMVLLIIGIMVVLAFIIEFLIAYLLKLYVFWTIESPQMHNIVMRLKKLMAGNYFPLSFLPILFVQASLLLPFAYGFFVPAQLYLKKMSISDGIKGMAIQIVWIILLYVLIKIKWQKKIKESLESKKIN